MTITRGQLCLDDLQAAAAVLTRFGEHPTMDALQLFLASERNVFIAASVDDAWVGFAYAYELVRPERGSMLFLYSIDVLPEYRRKGVATVMMSFLKEFAAARQMKELFVLTTHSNKPAVALYKATGGVIENGDDLLFTFPMQPRGDEERDTT